MVTEKMIEAALIKWFKNEISWDKGMAPWSADQFRAEMRATLEAALSSDEHLHLRERMVSDIKHLTEFLSESPDNIYHLDAGKVAELRSALSAQVQDVPDLDTRMKAAGMYTIAEMMGVTPLTKWKSNPAINTVEAFSEWLDRKVAEYLAMKVGYDLGDKSEDDELYEWVLAHAGVFSTIRDQFQVVTAAPAAKLEES